MSIPDNESIMLPLLKSLRGGKEMSLREHIDEMSEYFELSNEDKKLLMIIFQHNSESEIHYNSME